MLLTGSEDEAAVARIIGDQFVDEKRRTEIRDATSSNEVRERRGFPLGMITERNEVRLMVFSL
jgi:hypothetical protein